MDELEPFGEDHPGWDLLSPPEKRRFVEIKAKEEDGKDLLPGEDQELGGYKEIMRNGRPEKTKQK